MKLVVDRLRKQKLYAKLSKCNFGVQAVDYLSFVLRTGKLAMYLNKTKAIELWKTPTNKKELQSFLGFVNYYRRFIRNCLKIAKPLTELAKNVPFYWSRQSIVPSKNSRKLLSTHLYIHNSILREKYS